MRLFGVAFACLSSCLSTSLPRYYPRANRRQGSLRASERLLRGWGRRKGGLESNQGLPRDFMFVIPSHLGEGRLRRRSRKLPHFDVRPTVFRRGGGNECYGGGRRESERQVANRTSPPPPHRMWAGWTLDGRRTDTEGEEFSLYDMLPLE